MQQTLEEFFDEFRQEYLASAEAGEKFQIAAFMEVVTNDICENGDLDGYEYCYYDSGRGMRVDGYWFDDEGTLNLFVADFDTRDIVESLTQTEVTSTFKRVYNFLQACIEKDLYRDLELTSPEYSLARQISDRSDWIRKVNFILVSERRLSDRVQSIGADSIGGCSVAYHIWDLARLHRLRLSRGQREPLEIDFVELFGRGVPCLKANLTSETYRAFLMVMPGRYLADLYELYGARLLEQNVRAFLQNRGDVNKGIRTTILKEPSMFFAFNNGITATANTVEVEEGPSGHLITKVIDLQIVNGGQTTASLFHTRRSDKVSLSEIFVQVKLSIVSPEVGEVIVPKIAEYANTQNRVNAADLFSNSPFHIRIEAISRRLYAPPVGGSIRGTKWFYERTRGQFRDELSKRTPAEQKRFLVEYPKEHVFTKTDLAKYENVWDEHPRWVNLGAQKNFAKFAERMAAEWERDDALFNEFYFRRAVARALIFRTTEKLVSSQPWYDGGYRANIVAYSIALLAEIARQTGHVIDTAPVWRAQAVGDLLVSSLSLSAEFANREIRNPAVGISNVTEWCKRAALWERMKEHLSTLASELPHDFATLLIPVASERAESRDAKRDQLMVDGVTAVARAMTVSPRTWRQIRDRLREMRALTDKESGILSYVTQDPQRVPSDKQAAILMQILARGENEGIVIETVRR